MIATFLQLPMVIITKAAPKNPRKTTSHGLQEIA
jgi:hypothetical protein